MEPAMSVAVARVSVTDVAVAVVPAMLAGVARNGA
jgi:hypothetical protein